MNKNLPYYFDSFDITTQGSFHNCNTRQRDNVRLNRTRIKMTDKCLRNYLPEQLKSVPHIVSSKIYTHSLHGFSSAVKRFTLNNYSTEYLLLVMLHMARFCDLTILCSFSNAGRKYAIVLNDVVPSASRMKVKYSVAEGMSLISIRNKSGPRMDPCGTPVWITLFEDCVPFTSTYWVLWECTIEHFYACQQ